MTEPSNVTQPRLKPDAILGRHCATVMRRLRYLPDDILYETFQLATTDDRILGPIRLSHCCRQWRNVALNTSALWTTILVGRAGPQYLDRNLSWIERSRAHRLDIAVIQHSSEIYLVFANYLKVCLGVLVPLSGRWRSLSIYERGYGILPLVCRAVQSSRLFEVSKLCLILDNQVWAPTPGLNILLLELSNLQDLEVSGRLLNYLRDWRTITSFPPSLRRLVVRDPSISFFTLEGYCTTLRQCPLLEELIIDGLLRKYSRLVLELHPLLHRPPPERVIHAAKLKRLQLGSDLSEELSHSTLVFLSHVHAPLLHTILPDFTGLSSVPIITSMITFPFPSLQSLFLTGKVAVPEDAGSCGSINSSFALLLAQLPKLCHFGLSNAKLQPIFSRKEPHPFIKAMSTSCPSLEVLELVSLQGLEFSELEGLIKTRKQQSSDSFCKLRSLNLGQLLAPLWRHQEDWLIQNVERLYVDGKLIGYDSVRLP